MNNANVTLEGEPFQQEVRVALSSIESLTAGESAAILNFMVATGCEPIVAFASLHVTLSRVVSARHARSFLGSLREWGGNAAIGNALSKHWPRYAQPRYRPGDVGNLSKLDECFSLLSPIGEGTEERRPDVAKTLSATLRPGDIFRWRFKTWKPEEWVTYEVVTLTANGNLRVKRVGRKTLQTFSARNVTDPDATIELIRPGGGPPTLGGRSA